eukprot:366062-Chlamydomonas_euryale.AAC.7
MHAALAGVIDHGLVGANVHGLEACAAAAITVRAAKAYLPPACHVMQMHAGIEDEVLTTPYGIAL